ncbi:MAG: hypothetical protein ACK5IC_05215 [Moheibacter sp.]
MNSKQNELLNKNYDLKYSVVFNDAWSLFTRMLGIGVLTVALYGIASWIVGYFIQTITKFNATYNEFLMDIQGMEDPNALMYKLQDFYTENRVQ